MKVRIGNDIRLKIQLTYGEEDYANIQSAQAFFVNTTLKKKLEEEYKKKMRFIGRFPIEPFVDEFEPSAYNIHSSGFPKYRAFVANAYCGFGVRPDWKESAPIKDSDITTYRASIIHTSDPKVIIVDFPAKAQLFPGEFELIITAQIYDPGYKDSVRTVTANYKSIFELVADQSEEGVENPVQIEINNETDEDGKEDVYVVGGTYNNGSIKLTRNDHGYIDIDVKPVTNWYEGQ